MRIPMPSPRGTNTENLYFGDRPMAAYDAMPPLGGESAEVEPPLTVDDDETLKAVLEFLSDKLDPSDLAKVKQMFSPDDPAQAMDSATARDRRMAMYREGRISLNQATDPSFRLPTSRSVSNFNSRFPDASRIKLG